MALKVTLLGLPRALPRPWDYVLRRLCGHGWAARDAWRILSRGWCPAALPLMSEPLWTGLGLSGGWVQPPQRDVRVPVMAS